MVGRVENRVSVVAETASPGGANCRVGEHPDNLRAQVGVRETARGARRVASPTKLAKVRAW